ncbi:MAG: tRNA (adenosine(37)-N6)-threonylcarbamoyltransferase complex ATPase subunit type 1 TsaE, partial [Verrucomicrobia bacterium GWC2_42_7]
MNALEQLKIGILSHSAEETKSIAYRLGESLEGNQTILLDGDLGTGKTTFVRGLAESCGITQPITSPSYNIFNYYQGVRCNLIHVDAYRLDKDSQLADLLLEDFM